MIGWLLITAWALDLEQARDRAGSEALALEIARAERDAEKRSSAVVFGQALPAITAFAGASTGAGQTAFGFERPVTTLYSAGLRGTWTLVAPSTWAAAAAARRSTRGQQALLDWTEVQAREDATTLYAAAWGALQEEQALQTALQDATQGEQATQQRVEAGLAPDADAGRAVAERSAVQARLAQARGDTIAACAALQSLLGEPIDGDCDLQTPVWGEPQPEVDKHPALTAAREALAATRGRDVASWLDLAPQVTVGAVVAQYKAGERDWGLGWQLNAQVDLPLLDVPVIAGARADDAALRVAKAELEARRRDLAVALVAAGARYEAAQSTLIAQQRALQAAEAAFSQVDARLRQGLEGIDAWLATRQALEQERVNLARADAAMGTALAELESARGVR